MATRGEKITQSLRRKINSSDIPTNFDLNVDTGDLLVIYNQNAIKRSIINLVLTGPFERPYKPNLGSRIRRLLFENATALLSSQIKTEIETTIRNYEPRARVQNVLVEDKSDDNQYNVTIQFSTLEVAEIQTVSINLVRAR